MRKTLVLIPFLLLLGACDLIPSTTQAPPPTTEAAATVAPSPWIPQDCRAALTAEGSTGQGLLHRYDGWFGELAAAGENTHNIEVIDTARTLSDAVFVLNDPHLAACANLGSRVAGS